MTPRSIVTKMDIIWQRFGKILARFVIPIGIDPIELDRANKMIEIRSMVHQQRGLMPEAIIQWVWAATLDYQVIDDMCSTAMAMARAEHPGWRWRAEAIMSMIDRLESSIQHVTSLMDDADN